MSHSKDYVMDLEQRLEIARNVVLDWQVTADMYEAYSKALEEHLRIHGCKHDFVDVANDPKGAR